MANSIDLSSVIQDNRERAEVELGSLGAVKLLALRGEEELSTLFSFEGRARVPLSALRGGAGGIKPERVVGDWTSLTIRDFWGSERVIRGLCSDADVEVHDVGEATIRFTVRPEAYRLTLGASCRAFLDKDVIEIAQEVFSSVGLKANFNIRESYKKRVYTVQYNESDFDFVSRLFEEEGIYYWFDHAEGSVLTVADHSPGSPDLDDAAWRAGAPSGAAISYQPELGLESNVAFLRELGAKPRALAGKVSLGSFDFLKPSFKVAAENSGGPTEIEVYDAPGGGTEDPAELERRARVGAERAKAMASLHQGTSPSVRLSPGRVFELSGHPFGRLDGRYVITRAAFSIDNVGGLGSGGKPIDIAYVALAIGVPFRPLVTTPQPKHPGLQTSVVIGPSGEEIHTDESGRVRIQAHWDREGGKDDKSGRWVRVAQRGVAGSMMYPRMGWNVLSVGEEGSVDVPVAMARTFDGEHPPPYALPENKTRTAYRTGTSPGGGTFNELRFEDKKGAEEMFINSTGDMNVLVKDTKGELIHGYMVHKIGVDHTLEVGGTYDVHVEKNQTVFVGANQSEKVGTDRQKLVDGSESITVGSTRKLKTGVNAEIAGTSRNLKVGALNMSATLGGIKAQSKIVNQLVGGAVVKATPRKMTEEVGSEVNADTVIGMLPEKAQAAAAKLKSLPGVSGLLAKAKAKVGVAIQTIGVLKFEQGKDRKIDVTTNYTEKVMGLMNLVTDVGAFSDTAKQVFEMVTGSHEAKTQTLLVKSEKEVILKCGGSSITVDTKGVKIASPVIHLDDASGFSICHTKVDINPS